MADYRPANPFQHLLAALAQGQGAVARSAARKLRRRYNARAQADFDARLARLGPGDLCLDLGANVGVFTERLAATGADVWAFEPDPAAFALAQERVGRMPNVTLHQAAVAAEAGRLTLFRHKDFDRDPAHYSVATTIAHATARDDLTPAGEIEVVSFFDILTRAGRPFALIKMDIEGAEWDILARLFETDDLSGFDALFVETHEAIDPARRGELETYRARAAARSTPEINLYWH